MAHTIDAVYENGAFKPQAIDASRFAEGQRCRWTTLAGNTEMNWRAEIATLGTFAEQSVEIESGRLTQPGELSSLLNLFR